MLIKLARTTALLRDSKIYSQINTVNLNFVSFFRNLDKQMPVIQGQNPKQLLRKVKNQREKWAKLQKNEKKSILLKFYKNIQKSKNELAETITKSTGKQLIASIQEVENGLKMIKNQLQQKHTSRIIVQEKGYGSGYYDLLPYGSILQIISHHSPFFTISKYLILALVSNNSILFHSNKLAYPISHMIQNIWKQTNLSGQQKSSISQQGNSLLLKNFELYQQGKNSQNLNNLLEISDAVGFISFTGEVEDGNRFYHQLASKSQNFAQSQFLLQSCDSCHILEDLKNKTQKLKKCANIIAKASFSNGGSLPQSIKRLFIHPEMIDQFVPLLIQEAKLYRFSQNIKQSNLSATLKSQYLKVKKTLLQIQKFPQQFKVISGSFKDIKIQSPNFNSEDFIIFEPLIIKIQTQYPSFSYQSQVYPIPIIFIHPSSSINQTIQLINSSIFGLTHTLFTQNQTIIKDIKRIGQKIDVGTINVNNCQFRSQLPISPRKRSGKGYSNCMEINSITRSKSVTF